MNDMKILKTLTKTIEYNDKQYTFVVIEEQEECEVDAIACTLFVNKFYLRDPDTENLILAFETAGGSSVDEIDATLEVLAYDAIDRAFETEDDEGRTGCNGDCDSCHFAAGECRAEDANGDISEGNDNDNSVHVKLELDLDEDDVDGILRAINEIIEGIEE